MLSEQEVEELRNARKTHIQVAYSQAVRGELLLLSVATISGKIAKRENADMRDVGQSMIEDLMEKFGESNALADEAHSETKRLSLLISEYNRFKREQTDSKERNTA